MNREDILYLIQYHNRANAKIFETAAKLSKEQLMRRGEFDHETAYQSLRHMVDVDWSWRQFCMGNDIGKTYLWDIKPMTNFEETYAAWVQDGAELFAYAESLNDETLLQPVIINREKGEYAPMWQVLAHVVNHGTQHRSELARYFTVCGYSPGDLDLL
jgi:uncharacterized damage-inducible protein DinB